jgi:trehalose 6-phosphate phosphatase
VTELDGPISERLKAVARVPVLLVASDYDGTIAPIVSDPALAVPNREAMVALRNLAELPHTHVAVISGRALKTLGDLLGGAHKMHLVGSHGSEFDPGFAAGLPGETVALLGRVTDELTRIAQAGTGFLVEPKPGSVAFHYRNAPDPEAQAALRHVLEGPARWPGVLVHHGKRVVELSVVQSNKGTALDKLRQKLGVSATVFVGDDLTDENVFAVLRGPDVGIKVGPELTKASLRVRDVHEVTRVLAQLTELRSDWAAGAEAVPIENHAMLSDQRALALVAPDARLVWLCLPRLDAAAMFAELVGGPAAGRFSIRPAGEDVPVPVQRYVDQTMILETRWPAMTVTDFFDCSAGRPTQRAGRSDLIRTVAGTGEAVVEFAPRLDFGRVATRLKVLDGGIEIEDSRDPVVLRCSQCKWEIVQEGNHQTARAVMDLSKGPVTLELRYGIGSLREAVAPVADRRRLTERYWSGWAEQLRLPAVEPDLIRRSAIVLKALCYGPTGAIAAAATTSLPEHIGGVRNWDYRFCWLRDAAMSAAALVKLGSIGEAMQYLDWVLGVIDEVASPERLSPLYTVTGHGLGPEAEIGELSGYRGSRPVRVGNGASGQVQLDVFGPIVELVHLLAEVEAPLSSEHWRLVDAMVQAVQKRWFEPDHGIWEIRKPRRHHVHSKVMCWLAVDRAISIANRFLGRSRPDWEKLRETIATDVLTKGFKPDVGAFTAAYDGTDLDAACLWVGLSGLLPPGDPRFAGTVAAIEAELRQGPTVYRYRADDGLPGFEGGFHICTSWLVDAYLLCGRREDATALFRDLVSLAGPTQLYPEQCSPAIRKGLGNHPQAYSHLGLIENALHLSRIAASAAQSAPAPPPPSATSAA